MKKSMFFVILISCVVTLTAQEDKWLVFERGKEAFSNQLFRSYNPQFFNGHKELGAGEDTISFPQFTLVKMIIVGGRFWVIQDPWTVFVIKDGKIIRRWDCGNDIGGFFKLPTPSPPTQESLAFKVKEVNVNGRIDIYHHFDEILLKTEDVYQKISTSSWFSENWGWLAGAVAIIAAVIVYIYWPDPPAAKVTPVVVSPPDVNTGGVNKIYFGLRFGL